MWIISVHIYVLIDWHGNYIDIKEINPKFIGEKSFSSKLGICGFTEWTNHAHYIYTAKIGNAIN